ncbi:hypothetical protein HK097_001137 [Rhizophlyctis rosea]|uniref:FHA domain-containing protein n=1 Tax=Rhizophlyctis rosea TaxID=64517 RepID=A0AAD5X1J3_9FUNG|nr:hypothetical protein HK097_001137 [Rhizophlyctis rosea]
MATRDLNDDCWTHCTSYLANTSINELLKCGTLNRRFENLVDTHPFWVSLGKRLKVGPPKPRARKYKTWKSLPVQFVIDDTNRVKSTYSVEQTGNTLSLNSENSPSSQNATLQKSSRHHKQFAERRAVVKEKFSDVGSNREVADWVRTGTGNIDQIVQEIRDKIAREELVAQKIPQFVGEWAVRRWMNWKEGDIDQIMQAIQNKISRQELVDRQFPQFAGERKVLIFRQRNAKRDDRRAELKAKLAAFGLSLREDATLGNQYIHEGYGNADEIVTCEREIERYIRCTKYQELKRERDHGRLWRRKSEYNDFLRCYRMYNGRSDVGLKWSGIAKFFGLEQTSTASDVPPKSLWTIINALLGNRFKVTTVAESPAVENPATREPVSETTQEGEQVQQQQSSHLGSPALDEKEDNYISKRLEEDLENDEKKVAAHLRMFPNGGDLLEEVLVALRTVINVIGRFGSQTDVDIEAKGVSRPHALIEISSSGTEHFIEDLDSTNGTTIGRSSLPITPFRCYALSHGMEIKFAGARCHYEVIGEWEECGM